MSPQIKQQGFTLLEVMIAFAIIVVILAAAFTAQSGSLASSTRNRSIIIATSLARNLINEQELKYEGLPMSRLPEKSGPENFPAPNDKIKWTITYSKVDFSALTDLIARATKDEKKSGGDDQSQTILRIFKEYLEKSVRRMTVTIEWPDGGGSSSQTFTQLLVNYDEELSVAI
jgi:prepilin-type N-terminal cleavage/methylation domain-containing protein